MLGRKVISVPVLRAPLPSPGRCGASPTTLSGASASPSRKRMKCSLPSRQMRSSSARGERVDDRDADAVQAARDLVGVLVELTAGMELGHDDLGRRDAFLLLDVDRDAAAVVATVTEPSALSVTVDRVAIAGERLVDRIVDDLVDHVVQARAVIGVADIHARALAHGIEAAQHLDRLRVVFALLGTGARESLIDLLSLCVSPAR